MQSDGLLLIKNKQNSNKQNYPIGENMTAGKAGLGRAGQD